MNIISCSHSKNANAFNILSSNSLDMNVSILPKLNRELRRQNLYFCLKLYKNACNSLSSIPPNINVKILPKTNSRGENDKTSTTRALPKKNPEKVDDLVEGTALNGFRGRTGRCGRRPDSRVLSMCMVSDFVHLRDVRKCLDSISQSAQPTTEIRVTEVVV